MVINVPNSELKIENGKLIINISADIEKLITGNKLENKTAGDVVTIGGVEYIVLEQMEGKTVCITKDFAFIGIFGKTNYFRDESGILFVLHGWLRNNVYNKVGEDAVCEQEIDLTSMDGLDDYGKIIYKISLLSMWQYQKYHKILGLKTNYSKCLWLVNPYSTPSNGYNTHVVFVDSDGSLGYVDHECRLGVRPVVIFDSSILV